MSLSVIVPAYFEAEVIEPTIRTLFEYLKQHFQTFEIIVVTDGNPDGTAERVGKLKQEQPAIPLLHIAFHRNHGKGAAVRAGVLASHYDPILVIDADLTIPIEELHTFLSALETADIAIASRLLPGARFEESPPWYRIVMARGFHLLQILILGNFEFSDTQCGFKLFRRSVALDLFNRLTVKRFAYDAEILYLAKRSNYKITALPVIIRRDPRNTNVRPVADSINMFFALLKIRWNNWHRKL